MISSFAGRLANFNPTGPAEDKSQKLISSTGCKRISWIFGFSATSIKSEGSALSNGPLRKQKF